MAKKITSFEAYIETSSDFAQPILVYLRQCIHDVYPDFGEEIKWNFPCFTYNGSILASMASFKTHVSFGFWLSKEMSDTYSVFVEGEKTGMGNFGKIRSIDELPKKEVLHEYIREAMALVDAGKKLSVTPRKKIIEANELFLKQLNSFPSAKENFERFSSSQQGEYHEWINDAKADSTRQIVWNGLPKENHAIGNT
jgi:uncharacterized protein YdeI (YjbR/CyaY-like superfamily)